MTCRKSPASVPRSRIRTQASAAYRFEHALVALVVDAVLEGEVDSVALPAALALVSLCACSGEKVAKLVERGGHDAVGGVKGLFDAVAVVDVDVDVEDAGVVAEELEDGKDNVCGMKLSGVVSRYASRWRTDR